MINRIHIFQSNKIDTITKYLITLKRVLQISNKKGFDILYKNMFTVGFNNNSFYVDYKNSKIIDIDIDLDSFIHNLDKSYFKTCFKNTEKRLMFSLSENKIFF